MRAEEIIHRDAVGAAQERACSQPWDRAGRTGLPLLNWSAGSFIGQAGVTVNK